MLITVKIFRFLREHPNISLAELERGVKETRQLILYHLQCLVKKGIVVKEGFFYHLQSFLSDPAVTDRVLELFAELLETYGLERNADQEYDHVDIIRSGIELFTQSFNEEIRQLLILKK